MSLKIKIILSILMMPIAFILIFSVSTILSINDRLITLSNHQNKEIRELYFESGAIVDKTRFETFYSFSDFSKSSTELLKELSEEKVININGEKIEILKDFNIKDLIKNDCKDLYCYQVLIPFKYISSSVWKGLIGIEDFRFLGHGGVDFISIMRAIIVDIKEMRLAQGGSTITQQLAKNLFYSSEKTLVRKLKEIITSIYIESKYSKDQILELYFNNVFWGTISGVNLKGVFSASYAYFEKHPLNLTSFESAILISMLKGPNYYSPLKNLERLKSRTKIVIKKLKSLGFFTTIKEIIWSDEDWRRWAESLRERSKEQMIRNLWLTQKNSYDGMDSYRKFVMITESSKLVKRLKNEKELNVSVKILVRNIKTNKEFKYYSNHERGTERAINNEAHQIGSTIKPILYSVFFELGIDPKSKISTEKIQLDLNSGLWSPKDSSNTLESEIEVELALKKSMNIPTIRIANNLGFEILENPLKDYFINLKTPLKQFPSQLLGAIELSLKDLLDAYLKFFKKECAHDQRVMNILKDPTKTTIKRAAGEVLSGMEFFGKTGTTNLGLGNWFVFYDGLLLGAIWVGVEVNDSLDDKNLYGSSTSFRIFKQFMLTNGKRFNEFSCDKIN